MSQPFVFWLHSQSGCILEFFINSGQQNQKLVPDTDLLEYVEVIVVC